MLAVELESTTVRPGATIRGVVRFKAARAVDCRSLSVRLAWSLRSGGERRRGAVQSLALGRGRWPPGERLFDFELEVPGGPPTELSSLVELRWRVEARAELSFGRVRRAAAPFTLERGEGGARVGIDELAPLEPEGLALSLAGALLLWLATAAVAAVAVEAVRDASLGPVRAFVVLWLLWMIGFSVKATIDVVRRPIAERALGHVTLRRVSGGLSRGPLVVEAELQPRRSVTLAPVSARVVARSTYTDSDGRTRVRIDYRGAALRFGGGAVRRGEGVSWRGELPIPAGLAQRSAGTWTVDVRVPIPRSPDWEGAIALPRVDL
ncbi:MAG: hypothetical protein R3A79_16815 [Nannocystaceae bacterium]